MNIRSVLTRSLRAFAVGTLLGAGVMYLAFFVWADTGVVRPNADGTSVAGTAVGCTSGLRYECLNDVVVQPTVPDTSTDYLQMVNNDTTHVQLSTVTDVDVVTELTVWIYHREGAANAVLSTGLFAANETTAYGAVTTLPNRTGAQWDSVTYSGLSLTQAQLDAMRLRLACGKSGGGASNDCFAYVAYVDLTYEPLIEVTVGTTGTQQNLDIGATSAHVGGSFSITENVSSRSVTGITLNETGTIDAATNLSNIALFYDLDTTTPYDCVSETYDGTEAQFGSTAAGGFSAANGSLTFTDSVTITTTQALCVYPVLDVETTSAAGDTIELEITDPTTDVVAGGSPDIRPLTTVALAGSSVVQAQDRNQIHYHWRNDDGSETTASSATGGSEDTTLNALGISNPVRLRLGISNEGNRTSDATQYRLEYAQKVSTCSAATGWADVGAAGGDFDMFNSVNLTDGSDTTNIPVSSGGVSDENTTFLTPNGGVLDTSSQTGALTLTSTEFLELEYALIASTTATAGNTYCFRVTDTGNELETYSVYPEATILADVTVDATGTLQSTVDIPSTDVVSGAQFTIVDNIVGDTTIEEITITATGTVDLQNDINNIELRYDLDTTAPYNCVSESYNGTESQFGATQANFSGANTATFTGSQIVNTTQAMCIYIVYDASSAITDGQQLDLRITNPSAHVSIDAGTVAPNALVDLAGETTFVTDNAAQVHYHWRNDNGSEVDATSATAEAEDTPLENLRPDVPERLRIGVANEGSSSTPAYQYRLEYALKVSTCAAASGWTDVGATDDEFNMFDSPNITDGSNTTNIPVSSGGVTDEGDTYLSTNNAVKDTSSQTGALVLAGKQFVDLEYSLVASSSATEGATYCFRVTDAGTPLPSYATYPEVSIKPKTDYFVQRGVTTVSGTSVTLTAGTDYVAPSSANNAFIRIVGTHNSGAGSPTNSGNADDTTVYISNPGNITSSITFTRPATAVDSTRVAWEIIEYDGAPGGNNEMIVRAQGTVTYAGANTSVTTGTVPGIADDADVAVFITGHGNPDTATNYAYGLSTAAWNGGTDTATFTRGASSNASVVSYAVVEFVGSNWKVQRAEHTYTSAGTTETQAITAVSSLSRAFLHSQKRLGTGLTNHSDYGHNVWLSSIGQVSFALEASAASPASHTSVAWVIENTQTIGDTMRVTRSNGSESSGTAPKTVNANIGATISDTQDASLFINNHGNEAGGGSTQNSFPEPIISAEIISETQYQLWIAQPDNDTRTWRAEVVEWPTAARDIAQNYYRFYVDNGALDPTDPWPAGATDVGENTEITELDSPIAENETMRLRMTLQISSAAMEPGIDAFTLQYGERTTTCSAITEGEWTDVGDVGSATALWRATSTALTPGTPLSTDPPTAGDLNISVADVAGTFETENPSAFTPYVVDPGEDVEFDWLIEHNGAKQKTTYCFRMVESDGDLFETYNFYPAMRTAGYTPLLRDWRFYQADGLLTPVSPLAGENTTPNDIDDNDVFLLRANVAETTGGEGTDVKFKLQFSEYSDFSAEVEEVVTQASCTENSLWCYADAAGIDNEQIVEAVLSTSDSCTGGSGVGCGTYNETTSTSTATNDQPAYSTAEYQFALQNAGARVNAVYYFRLVLISETESVVVASSSLPSVLSASSTMSFSGAETVSPGTTSDGFTANATSTASSIEFASILPASTYIAIQRLTINTNATQGYRVFAQTDQLLTNTYGDTIQAVSGTNESPRSWATACDLTLNTGCFGYHTSDDVLSDQGDGTIRFAADDSFAALTTEPKEIFYSSVPGSETHDMIYRVEVAPEQPAGDYSAGVTYVVIPVF